MVKLDLGPVGGSVTPREDRASTAWRSLRARLLDDLAGWRAASASRQLRAVVDATRDVKVASGITSVDRAGQPPQSDVRNCSVAAT
jgi:hypothetical protein